MATRKRREYTPRKTGSRRDTSNSDVDDVQIKHEIGREENMRFSGYNSGGGQASAMLDVLAQVATETLEKEPRITSPINTAKKLTKRSVQSLDVLTLEQIRMLSDKALVNMFAEMTANEMTRNYTFQCYLMPSECHETFTSFGNENRARMRVRAHLLSHIGGFLKESSGSVKGSGQFSAEPIPARKKRLQAELSAQKKLTTKLAKQKKAQTIKSNRVHARKQSSDDGFTSVRPTPPHGGDSPTDDASPKRPIRRAAEDSIGMWAENSSDSSTSIAGSKSRATKKPTVLKKPNSGVHFVGRNAPLRVCINRELEKDENRIQRNNQSSLLEKVKEQEAPKYTNMEENEQLIIDLLSRAQPYMDHNYTSIFGKRTLHEKIFPDGEMSDQDDDDHAARSSGKRIKNAQTSVDNTDTADATNKTLTLKVSAGTVPALSNIHIPIIRLSRIPVAPDGTPLVSAEEVVIQENDALEEIMRKHNLGSSNATRPYPPMPKSDLARRGKVVVPEEEMSSSEEETLVEVPRRRVREARRVVEGSAEWERKMALKCIRELRCKKKEATLLLCKICKNKSFTATATLMYHYRSHAGIKPFVCLICNTTFTRQHSLNYHMLIHNNQSRFTCKDCGRKFRHPSHFKGTSGQCRRHCADVPCQINEVYRPTLVDKEHLRRHTGETPFHCTDCPLRFKTRNTYKRHLKTRHGKLLTAKGIRHMAYEDYLKVRSKKPHMHIGEMASEEEEEEEDDDDIGDDIEDDEIDSGNDADSTSAVPIGNDGTTDAVIPNRLLQFCQQVAEVS